jgi:hypothetical protein
MKRERHGAERNACSEINETPEEAKLSADDPSYPTTPSWVGSQKQAERTPSPPVLCPITKYCTLGRYTLLYSGEINWEEVEEAVKFKLEIQRESALAPSFAGGCWL